jgi:methyl-accepting chemotaxis protein
MSYTTAEGREQILSDLAVAIEQIADSIAVLGEAYEQLDERAGDVLEEDLFRPVQAAYARARRTYADFAARSNLRARSFSAHSPGRVGQSIQSLIERAVDAVHDADQSIADLQDSLLPVEVGDPELRAGLSGVRETLSNVALRARELTRTVGR